MPRRRISKIRRKALFCTECGYSIDIPRRKGRSRAFGHIKDLYCYICKRKTKFREEV